MSASTPTPPSPSPASPPPNPKAPPPALMRPRRRCTAPPFRRAAFLGGPAKLREKMVKITALLVLKYEPEGSDAVILVNASRSLSASSAALSPNAPPPVSASQCSTKRTKKFDTPDLLDHLPALQQLLFRLLGCQVSGLPFDKYSWLVTHNAFSIVDEPSVTGAQRITFYNQEDSVTNQLRNGVRELMVDMYDFENDIWLCDSFRGQCYNFTAFQPAVYTLREVEAFLTQNPSEIVTIIIEDYVHTPKALTRLFTDAGLNKYWYPVAKMTKKGF